MSAAEHRDNVRTPAASASGADAQLREANTMATREDRRAIYSPRQRAVITVAALLYVPGDIGVHFAVALAEDIATIALLGRESCSPAEVRARIAALLVRRLSARDPHGGLSAHFLAQVALERIDSILRTGGAAGTAEQGHGWASTTNT